MRYRRRPIRRILDYGQFGDFTAIGGTVAKFGLTVNHGCSRLLELAASNREHNGSPNGAKSLTI